MSTMSLPSKTEERQAGMVAIMVTLVLMIIISLIVLGFAQISRRNQRQAVDRQLSTQAFYAAETGVNDVVKIIKEAVGSGLAVAEKTSCASDGSAFYTALRPVIDAGANVEYTCLTVDPTPDALGYDTIDTTSTVIPIIATSGNIASIKLTWKVGGGTTVASCPTNTTSLPPANSSWTCGYGLLRFDLVETAGAALGMDQLRDRTMTSFVVPLRPGSAAAATSNPINFSTGGANNKLGTVCSTTECSYVINFPTPLSQYYMRVSSLYKPVSLQLTAHTAANASGNQIELQGAQAVIDATGKAEDVLRRIQVRIPTTPSSANLNGDYALQSTEAICKRFSVMNGYFQSAANAAVGGVGPAYASNDLCQ